MRRNRIASYTSNASEGRESVSLSSSCASNIRRLRIRNLLVHEGQASRPATRTSQPSPSVPGVGKISALVPESGIDPLSSSTVGDHQRCSAFNLVQPSTFNLQCSTFCIPKRSTKSHKVPQSSTTFNKVQQRFHNVVLVVEYARHARCLLRSTH